MVHLDSEGILKPGREIQALHFLPDDLLLRTRLRKKAGGGDEKEPPPAPPNIQPRFIFCLLLLFSSERGCLRVHPGPQRQNKIPLTEGLSREKS